MLFKFVSLLWMITLNNLNFVSKDFWCDNKKPMFYRTVRTVRYKMKLKFRTQLFILASSCPIKLNFSTWRPVRQICAVLITPELNVLFFFFYCNFKNFFYSANFCKVNFMLIPTSNTPHAKNFLVYVLRNEFVLPRCKDSSSAVQRQASACAPPLRNQLNGQ